MMKKKVKKIPKYNAGGSVLDTLLKNNPLSGNPMGSTNNNSTNNFSKFSDWKGTSANPWKDMTSTQKTGAVIDAVGAIGQGLGVATSGQDVNVGTALSTAAGMAGAGMTIGGPIGAAIGAGVGAIMGTAGRKVGYDADSSSTNFDDIYDPGSGWLSWFGHKGDAKRKANLVLNSNISKIQSENIKEMYYSDPNVTLQPTTAAEGGIMRLPVDALVSKGELIYNPVTKKLSQVPGSKGKPNKADDVYTKLYEGDVVISNSPTMLMANGKTPAQNLIGMIDKYATGGTVKAREAIIKKVVNWQEANKTKPQEYAKFSEGIKGVNKYGYNKNLLEFAYWDKEKNDYTDEYKNWVKNLTEQDVRDIESGKYGDMSTYFGKNPGKKLGITTAQQLMTDKKYGDWHKIGKAFVDNKKTSVKQEPISPQPIKRKIIGTTMYQDVHPGNYPIDYEVSPVGMDLKKVPDPNIAEVSKQIRQKERKQRFNDWLSNAGNTLFDLALLAAALFGDYDYHTESSQISPAKYLPTGVSTEPIRRAANESYAMARYNQANISPNTGAGMAYGLQAASNRAKTLADAYTWQQDAQNKLIAQNVGIYNDWRKQRDAYATQAIADTRANEGAAQQMKDQARKDRSEFYYGKRNDDMLTAMLEPMFEYGTPDKAYRLIYKRRIV